MNDVIIQFVRIIFISKGMFYKGVKYFLSEYFSQNFRNDSLYLGSCNLPTTDILLAKCLILADGSK